MASPELTKMSIENTPTATQPTASFDKQLADIKSQAAKIVTAAQKVDPNIKISTANAEMIGLPKVDIPTTKKTTPTPTELSRVGTTVIPKTSQDVAREAILSQVPEADRDTISQILDISTGYQTERGRALESTAESILTQQLSNIQSTRDRALESSQMKEAAKLPELEAELESIRGEYDVMQARRNAAIQAEERRQGVSTQAMQGNVARIERDFNLEQANFAIRELAAVGKINAATKLISAKLDLKYGDLEAETELLTAQLNAISPFLTREDQKAAETRLQLNEIVKTKIADARADDKALEEFKLQSYLFAQQNGATPATLSQIMSSTSREDVASVGGAFIQDPMQKLQMENIRSQMATDVLNREKLRKELNSVPTAPTQVIDVGGTKQLINTQTGEVVATFGAEEDAKIQEVKVATDTQFINTIDSLKTHSGMNKAVGAIGLARWTPFKADVSTGEVSGFIGSIDQLTKDMTLNKLISSKGEGATFGALATEEMKLLADSATKINAWRRTDDSGNTTHYETSEKNMKKELDLISNFAKLDFVLQHPNVNPSTVGIVKTDDGHYWAENSDGTLTQLR